jgi:TRAP-type C4-dicarboxylate transport system substrate-binding protein
MQYEIREKTSSILKKMKERRRANMKNSKMYVLILLASVFVGILPLSAFSQGKPIELRLAHMFPVTSPSGVHIENWAKKIASDSNGRLTIRIFPGNTLIAGPELYDGVARGVSDLSFGIRYKPEGYVLGAAIPFILGAPDTQTAGRIYDEIWKKFPKVMADEWKEVKVLWLAPTQVQTIITKKLVRTIEDMKGLQIRVPSRELGDLMKDLGATPVFMSMADFVIGIEKGTVDGVASQPGGIYENKLAGKVRYALDLSLGVPTPMMVIINWDSYNNLLSDLKSVIDKNCEYGKEGTTKVWSDLLEEAKKYFKAEGIEWIQLSREEKARWIPIIENSRDRVGKTLDGKGYPGTEVIRFIRERVEYYAR